MSDEAYRFALRVYYEDTDLAGIVYHANYLRFIERARSEALRALGVDQVVIKERDGLVFVAHKINARFRRPARFDDLLEVETRLRDLKRASVSLGQRVLRDDEILFEAEVVLAMIDESGRPVRFPPIVEAAFASLPVS
ncbi:MAG: tol-pal system-associated acyl-CoA thioesterase [Pseudomonadota bacterium]